MATEYRLPFTAKEIEEKLNKIDNYCTEIEVDEKLDSKVNTPTTAEIGQMLIVKEVDENGKPTKWECVDRTHYEEKVELLAETTATFDISMDFGYPMNECLDLKVGEECTIKWNDKEYTCVAKEYEVEGTAIGVAVGNVSFMEGQTSTGEPFCIMSIYPECSAMLGGFGSAVFDIEGYMADEEGQEYSATNTFSIKKTSVKKLDNKFLDLEWLPTLIPKEEKIYENTISFGNSRTETFSPRPFELVSGKTYIVEWNGERYECVCRSVTVSGNVDGAPDGSGIYVIGNTTLDLIADDYFSPTDKDKPFLYMYSIKEGNVFDLDCICGFASNAINVDIPVKVYGVDYVPNIIPKEFLPEHSWNNLEDRPFYSEGGGEAVELVNETVEYTDDGYIVTTPFELVVGDTYKVSYDGTEHECVCWTYTNDGVTGLILGNGEMFTGNNTGEPFCIIQLVDMGVTLFAPFNTEVTEPVHLVISGVPKEVVHKLDNKYLDMEWIPSYKEVLLAEEITFISEDFNNGVVMGSVGDYLQDYSFYKDQKLAVYFDGEKYDTAYRTIGEGIDELAYIGNGVIGNTVLPNTGEPFCIVTNSGITHVICSEGEHTISVYELEPNPMPEEFLPEHIHDWSDLKEKYEEVLQNQTVACELSVTNGFVGVLTSVIPLTLGKKMKIIFSGVEYIDVVHLNDNGQYLYVGNGCFGEIGGADTGEPFCFATSNFGDGDDVSGLYATTNGNHTIVLYENVVNKLPEKFLPEHTHSWDNLKNKPFYEDVTESVITKEFECSGSFTSTTDKEFANILYENWENATVVCDGKECVLREVNVESKEDLRIEARGNRTYYIKIILENGRVWFGDNQGNWVTASISITVEKKVIKPIDAKFLPESVARTDHTHSWNDLEDKPFGEELTITTFKTENLTEVFEDNTPAPYVKYNSRNDKFFPFYDIGDNKVIVVFDGQSYVSTVQRGYCTDFIGNTSIIGSGLYFENDSDYEVVDTGEPFLIVYHDYNSTFLSIYVKDAGTHTISVGYGDATVHQLDEKFIPESVASGTLFVNITEDDENGYTADKTHAEIVEAHESGKVVQALYDGFILPLCCIYSNGCIFYLASDGFCKRIFINSGGGVDIEEYPYFEELFYSVSNYAEIDELNTANKTLVGAINEVNENKIQKPSIAEVGQILSVKTVDKNGIPIEFEAVEMPSGGSIGGFRLLKTVTLEENVSSFSIDLDKPIKTMFISTYKENGQMISLADGGVETPVECKYCLSVNNHNRKLWLESNTKTSDKTLYQHHYGLYNLSSNGILRGFGASLRAELGYSVNTGASACRGFDNTEINSVQLSPRNSTSYISKGTLIEIWGC